MPASMATRVRHRGHAVWRFTCPRQRGYGTRLGKCYSDSENTVDKSQENTLRVSPRDRKRWALLVGCGRLRRLGWWIHTSDAQRADGEVVDLGGAQPG